MKTKELTGAALDWAVAKAEGGYKPVAVPAYSTNWAQGGPIIEREEIHLVPGYSWEAIKEIDVQGDTEHVIAHGPAPLVAAMRCYVASKLGDDVQLPEVIK